MPPRPRRYAYADLSVFTKAERLEVEARGTSLRAWRFGSGPRVLVQHGWGGRTEQMSALIRALVDAGYAVLAVDAPGHGASGWRTSSSIVHFADAIDALLEREGPAIASVAHSLGGSAVARSMARGTPTGALFLVAPFSKPQRYFQGFLHMLGLDDETIAHAQSRAERKLGAQFASLDLRDNLRRATAPTLIVHDEHDRRVPFTGSERIADELTGVDLYRTEDLGHSRLLADPEVHARIISALHQIPAPAPTRFVRPSHSLSMLPTEELMADLEYGRA